MVPNDGIQLGNASEAVTMSSDGHEDVLEGLGFEVLGHLHGSLWVVPLFAPVFRKIPLFAT